VGEPFATASDIGTPKSHVTSKAEGKSTNVGEGAGAMGIQGKLQRPCGEVPSLEMRWVDAKGGGVGKSKKEKKPSQARTKKTLMRKNAPNKTGG